MIFFFFPFSFWDRLFVQAQIAWNSKCHQAGLDLTEIPECLCLLSIEIKGHVPPMPGKISLFFFKCTHCKESWFFTSKVEAVIVYYNGHDFLFYSYSENTPWLHWKSFQNKSCNQHIFSQKWNNKSVITNQSVIKHPKYTKDWGYTRPYIYALTPQYQK